MSVSKCELVLVSSPGESYRETVKRLESASEILDPKTSNDRKYGLVVCNTIPGIIQQAKALESSTKLPYFNMYSSNGPLLCRSAFKRKLQAVSVLVSTPKAALNMFQHGFLDKSLVHTCFIHGGERSSPCRQDDISCLLRDWILHSPSTSTVFLSPSFRQNSWISRLTHTDVGNQNSAEPIQPPVRFVKYCSRQILGTLHQQVNQQRKRDFPGSERPILRRHHDAFFTIARNWGVNAAEAYLKEFIARFEDERRCTYSSDGSCVKYQLQPVLDGLVGFIDHLQNALTILKSFPQDSMGRFQQLESVLRETQGDCVEMKFVIVLRTRQDCKVVASLLGETNKSRIVVEIGSKLGTSTKRGGRYSHLEAVAEGKYNILLTTPSVAQCLDFGERNHEVVVLWTDASPPAREQQKILIDISNACKAQELVVNLDASHKSAKNCEKVFFQASEAEPVGDTPVFESVLDRPTSGAKLALTHAPELFHRWLSTMPHDRYWLPSCQFRFIYQNSKTSKLRWICEISSWPALSPWQANVVGFLSESKRAAKRSACALALKQLDNLSQFDAYLRPSHHRRLQEHSSSPESDFDRKKTRSYSCDIPEIWGPTPTESSSNALVCHIYIVRTDGIELGEGKGVGFISFGKPLPIEEIPQFTIFDVVTTKPTLVTRSVSVEKAGVVELNPQQVALIRKFHSSVFRHLLPHLSAVSDWSWNDSDARPYAVAPLVCDLVSSQWLVDWVSVDVCWENVGADSASSSASKISWDSMSKELFEDYVKDAVLILQSNNQVGVGSEVRWDLSPDSKWPIEVKFLTPIKKMADSDADHTLLTTSSAPVEPAIETTPTKVKRTAANGEFYTYRDHYRDRWGIELADGFQPFITVKPFAFRAANVLIAPVMAPQVTLADISSPPKAASAETQFQWIPELCRKIPVAASTFRYLRLFPSILMRLEGLVKANHLIYEVIELMRPPNASGLVSHVLEALTAPSCAETFNFEQLETVGDCFLKYVASMDTFHRHPHLHENQLEMVKHSFVANRTLFDKSVRWNLGRYLSTRHCKLENWCPPGIRLSVSQTQNLNDKRVADIFEAILGACYRHGGGPLALQFLQCAGFLDLNTTGDVSNRISASSLPPSDPVFESRLSSLQHQLGYQFENPTLLTTALSHPSHKYSRILGSQLKFIGDSIIDLYTLDRWMMPQQNLATSKQLSPGDITDLRAAAVMGSSEAVFALMLRLDELLLTDSVELQNHLQELQERRLPRERLLQGTAKFSEFAAADAPDPLAASLEAMLGAVFLDSGGVNLENIFDVLDRTFKVMFLDKYLDLNQPQLALAPVKELGEIAARRYCTYIQREERQLRLFGTASCRVSVHRVPIALSFGTEKKEARKQSCTHAISKLRAETQWWDEVCDCKKPKGALKENKVDVQ